MIGMMQSCPQCGSADIVSLEIAETEADSTYECEACGVMFSGEEMDGNV